MRHAETAIFKKEKIMEICKEKGMDYENFREECELLDGLRGTYNRWVAFVHDREGYDFKDKYGKYHFVPADLVEEERNY